MNDPTPPTDETSDDVRTRILVATAELIATGGRDAATTRAVSAAANVQAPAIYRLFGDKRGLFDAVAAHILNAYIAKKAARKPHPDPFQDLRDGWDAHVEFGLAHPEVFAILSGDSHGGVPSPAATAGLHVLQRRIQNIARTGRLRVSEERAVAMVQAGGMGTVLSLLQQPVAHRDLGLSRTAREAVIAAITGEELPLSDNGPHGAATALRASLHLTAVLTPGERHLLSELLDRIANGD